LFRRSVVFALVVSFFLFFTHSLSAAYPIVPSNTWVPANSLALARSGATASLVSDGRVLVAGGFDSSGNPINSVEIYNSDGSVSVGPSMSVARANHSAMTLNNGDILVTGGITTAGGSATNSAELFDPALNTWTPVSLMVQPRAGHTMSQLPDGSVLIAGGANSNGPVALLEIFSASSNSFAPSATLATARTSHAAAVLPDGRVLITGGATVASGGSTQALASSEIFDPTTATVSAGPSLIMARSGHTATTTLNGLVVVIGGSNPSASSSGGGAAELASAEIFDPSATTPAFTQLAAKLATARTGHLAVLLPHNANVLVIGGTAAGAALSSVELYTPWTDTFQTTGSMMAARSSAVATALINAGGVGTDGQLLAAGGQNSAGALASAELYAFATVKTDAADYHPGTIVTITGSGWQPGETVTLSFLESPSIDTPGPYRTVADSNGNIVDTEFAPDSNDANVRFYLTAAGSSSGLQAQHTFTDTGISPPANVIATVTSPTSISLTWTNQNSNPQFTTEIDRAFVSPHGSCPVSGSTAYALDVSLPFPTSSRLDPIPAGYPVGEIVCYEVSVVNPGGQGSNRSAIVSVSAVVDNPPVANNDSYTVAAGSTLNVSAPGVLGNDTPGSGPVFQALQVTNPSLVVTIDSGPSNGTLTLITNGSFTYTPNAGFTGTDTFTYHDYDGYSYSNQATVTINVQALGTTTNIAAPAITYGQNGSVTVSVSSGSGTPTGNVSLSVAGGTAVSKALTSGSATFTSTEIAALGTPSSGTLTLSATYTAQNGFGASSANGTLTINKAVLLATADNKSMTYGGTLPAYTATLTGFVGTDTAATAVTGSASLTTTPAVPVNAGTYTITAALGNLAANNYTFNFANGSVTINPATLVITAGSGSMTYGGALPTLTTAFASFVNNDTVASLGAAFKCSTTATSSSGVGSYPSTCSGAVDPNYTISYVPGSVTINPATLTLNATGSGGIYNQLPYLASCSVATGLVNGDTVTLTLSYSSGGAPVNVGSYIATCTSSGNSNYQTATGQAGIIITPAQLTIGANNQSMAFGGVTPSFTASYSGLQGVDTPAVISGLTFATFTDNTLATPVSNFQTLKAGAYPLVPGGATAANYVIQYANGTLTVNKAILTGSVVITPGDPQTVAYGKAATATVYLNSYSIGGVNVLQSHPDPANPANILPPSLTVYLVPVGGAPSQAIKFGVGTAVPTYDNTTNTTGTTMTGWAASITANAPPPGQYNAVVYGDDPGDSSLSNLNLADTGYFYADTADISYPILTSNQLDVVPAALTITANSTSKTYGQSVTFAGTEFTTSGLVNGDTVTGVSLTSAGAPAAATVAGSPYSIVPSAAVGAGLANYTITYKNGTLTVNPATLTVTANSSSKTYGQTVTFAGTEFTPSGLVNGDTVTKVTLTSAGAPATATVSGSPYTIVPSAAVGTGISNYTINYVAGSLTVNPATLTITANSATKPYGAALPALSVSYNGFVNSDNSASLSPQPTISTTATASSPVGSYPITASGAANPNYAISYVAGTLKVTQVTLTITANNAIKPYGAALPALSVSYSGFVNGDTSASLSPQPTISTTATASSPVGSYPITASGAANPNYVISYVAGTLSVTQVTLTITANSATKPYGAALPGLSVSYSGFVNGDTSASLSPQPTIGTTATASSPVGSYPITASGAADPNYGITYVAGTLKITQVMLTITASSGTMTFGGAPPLIAPSYSGFVNGDAAIKLAPAPTCSTAATSVSIVGTYVSSCSGALDPNYNISYVPGTVTVTQASLIAGVTVSAPIPAVPTLSFQYSDPVVLTVTFPGTPLGGVSPDQSNTQVSLSIGTQQVASGVAFTCAGTPSVCTATATVDLVESPNGNGQMAPGGHQVKAIISNLNANFALSNAPATNLTIAQEDAAVGYNGTTYFAVPSTQTTVNIPASFTLQDATATGATSPIYDAYPGDITKTGTVVISLSGSYVDSSGTLHNNFSAPSCTVLVSAVLGQVGSNGLPSTATTAPCTFNGVPVNGTYQLTIAPGAGSYYAFPVGYDTSVPISTSNGGGGFITGGGYQTAKYLTSNPSGTGAAPLSLLGPMAAKMNFGYIAKYNKSGSNLQASANIIVRTSCMTAPVIQQLGLNYSPHPGNDGLCAYQIKSNKVISMTDNAYVSACTSTSTACTPGYGVLVVGANIQDVTSSNPVSVMGGGTLQLVMYDNSEPGIGNDTLTIQVTDNSGRLWFSNSWTGTKTAIYNGPKTGNAGLYAPVINGGNLQVH
jgi:hypothetical protein